MKKYSLLLAFLFAIVQASAQDTLHVYYDSLWRVTMANQAFYHRKKVKEGAGWKVWDYYSSGVLQMKGAYTDDSCKTSEGEFAWYTEKGTPVQSIVYDHGKMNGPSVVYYKNGKKQVEGNYRSDKYDGEWKGYYESGQISGKARFNNGKQVSATFYNEDGSAKNDVAAFFKDAEFPGGQEALYAFLGNQLKYPKDALKSEIQGIVVVQYLVSKEGTISDVRVVKPVNPSLDQEAVRVVKKMPKWKPALYAGVPHDTYFKLPVSFTITNK